MSFADFLRFHWAPAGNNNNANANPVPVDANIPPQNPPAVPVVNRFDGINNVDANAERRPLVNPDRQINLVNRLPVPPAQPLNPQLPGNNLRRRRVNQDSSSNSEHFEARSPEERKLDSSDRATDIFPVSSLEQQRAKPKASSSLIHDSDGEDERFQDALSSEWEDSFTADHPSLSPVSRDNIIHNDNPVQAVDISNEDEDDSDWSDSFSDSSDEAEGEVQRNGENQNVQGIIPGLLNEAEVAANNLAGGLAEEPEENDAEAEARAREELNARLNELGLGGAAGGGLNNDLNNAAEVGIEIRVALFELLGLEGPIYVMFRNAAWLLAFSSVYITVLAFFPYVIGTILAKLLSSKLTSYFILARKFDIFYGYELLEAINKQSIEKNPPLQFNDLLFIGLGYFTIAMAVFFVTGFFSILKNVFRDSSSNATSSVSTLFQTISLNLSQLSLIIKVGLLLVVRIFLLPISLG
jgi:hypothetical protein